MGWVAKLLRLLPNMLFDRLLAGRGRKKRRGETGSLRNCSNKGQESLCDPVTGQRTMDAEQVSSGGS
jgi:hypothetical protein